jgi:hypothetical protein
MRAKNLWKNEVKNWRGDLMTSVYHPISQNAENTP